MNILDIFNVVDFLFRFLSHREIFKILAESYFQLGVYMESNPKNKKL